ncbi:MAG: oxygenase MpaB family protein [Solirubrobacterales bacterium]
MHSALTTPAADAGYFPRSSSVLRRVHEERAVGLLWGQRALAIGAINPLNFFGTVNHTWARATPFQRLAHTAKMFETIFFGSRAEADAVLVMVDRMHQTVHGEIPEDMGTTKAGTPYSALDPGLMLWTIAVSADSARVFYEMLVGPLTGPERDALWSDYVRFGELFGMPRDIAPTSYEEFSSYWEEQISRPEAHLSREALHVGSAVMFEIPVPRAHRPAMRLHNLLLLGSLPPRVRELYGLRWSTAHAAALQTAVAMVKASRPITPRRVRLGPNTVLFDLVARAEKARIARGQPIPGALEPLA